MANIIFNSMRGEYSVIRLMDEHIGLEFRVQKEKKEYIDFIFGIEPRNRMVAKYEVAPRPRIKEKYIPIRDSFVDEEEPFFNFGRRSILRIAQESNSDGGYRKRTFLQFDRTVTELENDLHIISAELEFTLARNVPDQFDLIELSTLNRGFQEYGVTWMNQPTRREFIDVYPISGRIEEKVRFDISDHFKRWYDDGQVLNGFVMKEISGYNAGEVVFYSRESSFQPYLKVTYFDPDFNVPRHDELDMGFHILERGDSVIDFEMEVESFARSDYLPFEFKPLSVIGELSMHFGVNKPDFRTDFHVYKKMMDYKRIGFRVFHPLVDMSTEIFFGVNRPELHFVFNPRVINDFFWRFNVTKEFLKFDFEVTEQTHNLEFDAEIRAIEDLDFNFFVDDNFRYVNFNVIEQSRGIDLFYEVRAISEFDLSFYSSIDYRKLLFEVTEQTNNVEFDAEIRAVEDLDFEFVTTGDSVRLLFEVTEQTNNVEFDAEIRAVEDLDFEAVVTKPSSRLEFEVTEQTNNVEFDAEIRAISDIDFSAVVNKNEILLDFNTSEQSRAFDLSFDVRAINDLSVYFDVSKKSISADFFVDDPKHYLPVYFDAKAVDSKFMVFSVYKVLDDHIDFSFDKSIVNVDLDFEVNAVSDMPINFHVTNAKSEYKPLIFDTRKINDLPMEADIRAVRDITLDFEARNFLLDLEFDIFKKVSRIRLLNFEVRAVSDLMLDFEARQKKDLRFRMDVILQRSNDLVFEFEIDGEVITRKAYAFIM